MRVEDFDEELRRWEARHREWVGPIDQFIEASLCKVNRDGYSWADFERERKAIREQRLAGYDPRPEIQSILERMCEEYLGASREDREWCRIAAGDKAGVLNSLLGYVHSCADRIRAPEDLRPLRLGLAAA